MNQQTREKMKKIEQLKSYVAHHQIAVIFVTMWLLFFLVYAFYATQKMHFSQDAARDYILTQRNISQQNWLVGYGPKASVANFYLPPLYYQIHLILTLIFPKFYTVMAWFVIVLAAMVPGLLWLLLKDRGPSWLGIGLSAGYGLYYLVLVFSTQAWNPNSIPFLTMLFLLSWWKLILPDGKKGWIIVAWIALISAVSFHYQAVVLIPFSLILSCYAWIKRPQIRIWLIAAPLLACFLLLPMLLAELQSDFTNTRHIIDFFLGEHTYIYDRVSKPAYVFSYFPSFIDRLVLGQETPFLIYGRSVFFFGALALGLGSWKNKFERKWLLFISTYILTILVSLRMFKGDKLDYYLMTLFPMTPLLLGAIFLFLSSKRTMLLVVSFFILVLMPITVSGFQHGVGTSVNSYLQLKDEMSYLQAQVPEGKIALIFHDYTYANLYYFGITQLTNLQIDPSSTVIVDVCKKKDTWCKWTYRTTSDYRWTIPSDFYRYLEKIHARPDYTIRSSQEFANTEIVIGTLESSPTQLSNPLNTNTIQTGSDYLIQ